MEVLLGGLGAAAWAAYMASVGDGHTPHPVSLVRRLARQIGIADTPIPLMDALAHLPVAVDAATGSVRRGALPHPSPTTRAQ